MSKIATVKLYLLIVRFVSFRTFNHPIIGSSNPINASGNDFHKYLCSADESGTEGVINGFFCMQRHRGGLFFHVPRADLERFPKTVTLKDPHFINDTNIFVRYNCVVQLPCRYNKGAKESHVYNTG